MSPTLLPHAHPRQILAIDDDPAVLALLREVLEEAGYGVTTQTALDPDVPCLRQLAPDLILLDPRGRQTDDPWALVRHLHQDAATCTIPLVLCTGAVREVHATAAELAALAVPVVLKPFDLDRLLAVIARTLAPPDGALDA